MLYISQICGKLGGAWQVCSTLQVKLGDHGPSITKFLKTEVANILPQECTLQEMSFFLPAHF
jgi:hypothetical protein